MLFWFLIQYYVTPGLNKITPPPPLTHTHTHKKHGRKKIEKIKRSSEYPTTLIPGEKKSLVSGIG